MTKFEFPEISPRIFNPAPMVELDVGPADAADAGEGEGVLGAAATGAGGVAGTAGDAAAGEDVAASAADSGVLTDEIAV
ncbi:MAG: hypothetical protein WCA00_08075 [Candidatus Acidiferrales bacterium]